MIEGAPTDSSLTTSSTLELLSIHAGSAAIVKSISRVPHFVCSEVCDEPHDKAANPRTHSTSYAIRFRHTA